MRTRFHLHAAFTVFIRGMQGDVLAAMGSRLVVLRAHKYDRVPGKPKVREGGVVLLQLCICVFSCVRDE